MDLNNLIQKVKKPNNFSLFGKRVKVTFDNVQELLDNGYEPDELFDYVDQIKSTYTRVKLNNKWNLISGDNCLISPNQWFDAISIFLSNRYAIALIGDTKYLVYINGKTLEITFDNVQALLDKGFLAFELFDDVYNFVNGYSKVRLYNKWNLISKDYRLVSPNQWFDRIGDICDGYTWAKIGNTRYEIDTKGQLYDSNTMQPIDQPTTNNMTLNELKHIIRESVRRALINR